MAMFSGLKEQVLDFVNKVRSRFGAPTLDALPKGIPGNSMSCPIANALTMTTPEGDRILARVAGDTVSLLRVPAGQRLPADPFWALISNGADVTRMNAPQFVDEFIERFDNRKMPSLIAQ